MPAVDVALACPMRVHCFEPPCSTRNLAVLPQSTIPSSRNSTSAERSETKRSYWSNEGLEHGSSRLRSVTSGPHCRSMRRTGGMPCRRTCGCVQRRVQPLRNSRWLSKIGLESRARVGFILTPWALPQDISGGDALVRSQEFVAPAHPPQRASREGCPRRPLFGGQRRHGWFQRLRRCSLRRDAAASGQPRRGATAATSAEGNSRAGHRVSRGSYCSARCERAWDERVRRAGLDMPR